MQYTLLAMKSMASGNVLDKQREERWPNRTIIGDTAAGTTSSFKVQFDPWEIDSEYSDTEGIGGPMENLDVKDD